MLASVDKKGATLSDILRADGYGLGGASEQAVEQAIEGLALGAEAVQGCALGISCTASGPCAAGLAARQHTRLWHAVSLSLPCHASGSIGKCKRFGAVMGATVHREYCLPGFGEAYCKKQQRLARFSDVCRYVEVHIEQGVTLEGLDVPVAPVRAIAGQTRLAVMFKGMQARRICLAAIHGLRFTLVMLTSSTLFWVDAAMPVAEALHRLWRHRMMV